MTETMMLTSPRMRGDHVRTLQRLLAKNPYGKFYGGEIDGIFGDLTAQACYRAKFYCGYTKANLAKTAGPALIAILDGTTKLTAQMKARRRVRLNQGNDARTKRLLALEWARGEIGTREDPPGTNRTPYGRWYGWDGVAWCFIFVSNAYSVGGLPMHMAYCPYGVAAARAGTGGWSVVVNPEPGDIVFYDWADADPDADHVGLFEQWIDRANGIFMAVEGNTSAGTSGSQSNGGGVYRRERYTRDVVLFARYRP